LLAATAVTLATVGAGSAFASFGYISQFGSYGSGNGQFGFPWAVAVDPSSGDIYVTDRYQSRVQKFDSTGAYLGQFGSAGSGNGQFGYPLVGGVAVDPSNGDVYVADAYNSRVEKFNSAGAYLSQFGSFGVGNGQFSAPFGVAVDPSNRDVYVTDDSQRVEKFDSTGAYLSQFGSRGSGNGQFNSVFGVAVDPTSGDVYVTDSLANYRVEKFDSTGAYLSQFGSGLGSQGFASVYWVAVDPSSSDVYVPAGGVVEKFDSTGAYLSQLDNAGSGFYGAAVDPSTGDIYVTDGADRVVKFGQTDGTPPASTIGLSPATSNGQNGWYVSSVHATVSATDLDGSVAETRCALDPASPPAGFDAFPAGCAYSGAGADVTSDGQHTIYAASKDAAGNKETPGSASFKIDETPPTVSCGATPTFALHGAGGSVSASVSDATSGPASSSVSAPADVLLLARSR